MVSRQTPSRNAAQGSFVSSGHTRVLSLRRSTMEAKLGPLQSVIDQAGVRMAKGEAMKEKNESLVASLQVGSLLTFDRMPYCINRYKTVPHVA